MRIIAITRSDGGLSIMRLLSDDVTAEIVKWEAASGVRAITVTEISPTDFPKINAFRDAWELSGKTIITNMTKAREIHKNHLRSIRKPKLEKLDVDYMRADEAGDIVHKTQITAQKQALRDVTADPAIETAKTPEELVTVMPAALLI